MKDTSKLDAITALAWAEYQARADGSGIYELIPIEVQRAIWNVAFHQGLLALVKVPV